MTSDNDESLSNGEYPPRADLRKMLDEHPLPVLTPGLIDPVTMTANEANRQAKAVLDQFNKALLADDAKDLENCFYADQAYWKDQLALTYHLRTFTTPGVIAASLLETKALRGLADGMEIDKSAMFLPVTPVLQYIHCPFTFHTSSPGATCRGKILLLPVVEAGSQTIDWKIWILSTRLESLDLQHEDLELLKSPKEEFGKLESYTIDVCIIGGGNAAVALSARLKALNVTSVMLEQNPHPGDNWALRYDCMQFHIPTSYCELPYLSYDKGLQTPHFLTRDELASQIRRYIEAFHLNTINSAQIKSTHYNKIAEKWEIIYRTPAGQHKVTARQLVMATGIGSQKPNMPHIADRDVYNGISIHSARYKSAKLLKEQGAKSVIVVGSANTAFDVLEDCNAAGLQSTMVVRSPTYILPVDYVCDKLALGAYDAGVEEADDIFMSLPAYVDGQLVRGLLAMFASKEPERYAALEAAGFPVIDSRDPSSVLNHYILERAGGHYIDVGGTKVLETGQAGVKANVEPVAFTTGGLRFSDGSTVDADAVVWCTGFVVNVGETAAEIFGGSSDTSVNADESEHLLGPLEIASRLDSTWGVDVEGEIRGVWKRHLRLDNFWTTGGQTQQHRWHSRTLALQLKAALEGVLPPAYRRTPILSRD
ncbi:monooxygenase [Penicillium taxi]|uniref:monooxygenase n=1 Tax=Penicillium taxi TaxID=168475 RepID=UPI002544FDA0|nr:monooxygenase [Penicillium taxi]KAJ5894696.1 monooxygenase [Penicillium taxi]